MDSSGNYISEAGWSGSGGGISSYEAQPTYQKGVVTQSTTQRTIPDVSFDADPASGVSIYDSYDYGTSTPWITVGGTSVSSPCWAGLVAIADQGRTLAGGTSLDSSLMTSNGTLPKLYSMAQNNFHDITSGNNGYAAAAGYDLVTGRGSPIANTLVSNLLSPLYVTGSTPTGLQLSAPSTINFNFSTAVDPTSFTVADDVNSFTGPGGVNLTSQITGFSFLNGNTTLQITFTPQSAHGLYSMNIGPQILTANDASAMDQNQNGVPGEAADTYTATFGYEAQALQVTSITPANGSVIAPPPDHARCAF